MEGQQVFVDVPRLVIVVHVLQHRLVVIGVERGRQVESDDIAEADEVERGRRNQELRADQHLCPAVLEVEVDFIDRLVLRTVGEVDPQVDLADERAVEVLREAQIDRGDVFLDMRRLHQPVMAPAAPRSAIAQRDLVGVGVVEPPVAIGREPFERDREIVVVQGTGLERARPVTLVGFNVGLVALVARIAEIGVEGEGIGQLEFAVPAHRNQFVLAGVVIVAQDRHGAVEVPRGAKLRATNRGGLDVGEGRAIGPAVREPLRAAADLGLLEARIVEVERGVNRIARLEFERAHEAVALVAAVDCPGFLTVELVGVVGRVGRNREAEAFVAVALEVIDVPRGIEIGIAQRPAQGAGLVLPDQRDRAAPAPLRHVGIAAAVFVQLGANVDRDGVLAIGQRAHRAQIDRARQAHAGDVGIGALVDHHRRQQFGRILIELDRAVVARARLGAAVEQHGGEIWRKPADGDDLGAAGNALRGEAGQAGDRFGDRDVGQLADFFGRDRFDDARFILLGVDRVGQRIPDPRNDDFLALGLGRCFLGPGRLRQQAGHGQRRGSGHPESIGLRQAIRSLARLHPHHH